MVYRRSYGMRRRRFPFRRRRFTRKFNRRFGAGRRNFATSLQHGGFAGIRYGGRRMGLRRFRRAIFRETQFKPHYRSLDTQSATFQTGTTIGVGAPGVVFPELGANLTDGFWTTNGGLVNLDTGLAAPLFQGDIILRGGVINLNLVVLDAVTDTLGYRVDLVFVRQGGVNPQTVVPATAVWGWDPSVVPDFTISSGKTLRTWKGFLKYQNPTVQIEHKVKPRKIDQSTTLSGVNTGTGQFCFVVHIVNLTSITNVGIGVRWGHNFAFSGDAIGTT